jgi:hypothetical protein
MVLLLARCWLYKLLQQQVLPTHQRASFYADWIYRMIGISGVEAASRVLWGNTLGIKAGCALSKRASSGPTRLDPATLSPCEAFS